jgi:hypothetical protein
MRRTIRAALMAIAVAFPGLAAAHPGHGADPGSPLHYLLEPEHAVPLLGGAWVIALIVWRLRLTRRNSD